MERPQVVIETPAGKLRFVFNPGAVYCDGTINNGEGGCKVNGVEYSASCRLYLKDGKWDVQNHMDLHGTRREWSGNYNAAQMTTAARRKFKAICIEAVEKYLASNPDTGRLAWEAEHADNVKRARDKIADAEESLNNAREALAKLEAETYPG